MNNARTRHAFELERLAREKDREMNELKLRFFVNISLEFKTPLSLIIGPITSFLEGNVRPRCAKSISTSSSATPTNCWG